jgi:hypothetical protein
MTVRLDEKGWKQLAKASARLLEQVDRLGRDAAERLERDPHAEDVVDAAVVVMVFEAVRLSPEPAGVGRRPASRRKPKAARSRTTTSARRA